MEFDELLITTGVDALVRLVKEKQRIDIEDAAAILNIPVESLEDWARVLEEEGILRIEYRLTHIYMIWVKPTEEEIEEELTSFAEEKKDIQEEVKKVREKVGKETEGLEELQKSFSTFYTKAQKDIEKLEKTVAPLPAAKSISEDVFSNYQKELDNIGAELSDAKKALEGISGEIKELKVEEGESESKKILERMETMDAELRGLETELKGIKSRADQELPKDVKMPSVADIRKKFESIKKNFDDLKTRNARLREDMISLHESSEILQSVAESIVGQEEKIGELNDEISSIAKEADDLLKKATDVNKKVKQNLELVERLGDSVSTSKNILKKFPTQKKVFAELDKLKEEENKVMEKTKSLEKILEATGGRKVAAKQFAEISKRMDVKTKQMRKDLDALEAALEHEKGTYLTFQQIKERIVPSIESYRKKLAEMDGKIVEIRKNALSEKQSLDKDAKELQQKLKGGQMQGIMKVAEEIRQKKKMLAEIKSSLDDLVDLSDNLNKRITLLSREAKILEIRGGGKAEPDAVVKEKEKEVRHQLELSKEEEMEFRRKRAELKKLIKTLWESEG